MENEVLELVKVDSSVPIVVHLLQQLSCVPLLHRNLQLYQHFLQLIQTQKVVLINIKLIEKLFQDKLLMSSFSPLNQLKPYQLNRALYFLWLYFLKRHIRHSPLRTDKFDESLIVRNVQTQVIIKIEKLFLHNISISTHWY